MKCVIVTMIDDDDFDDDDDFNDPDHDLSHLTAIQLTSIRMSRIQNISN